MTSAALNTFTTPGAATEYRLRYPEAAERVFVLENGYDEETFADAAVLGGALTPLNAGTLTLLHSGIVYPSERDPTQLMAALRRMHDAGTLRPGLLKIRFRAAVAEELIRALAERYGVQLYIEICPPVSYREALGEMLKADGLLLLQASNCNAQIPAKLYEYLRAGRPIICLTDHAGDTASVLRAAGIDSIASLDSADGIAQLLSRLIGPAPHDLRTMGNAAFIAAASRQGRAESLAEMLNRVMAKPGPT